MKILLEHLCVLRELLSAGYDVVWAGEWEADPGDTEILAYAWQELKPRKFAIGYVGEIPENLAVML